MSMFVYFQHAKVCTRLQVSYSSSIFTNMKNRYETVKAYGLHVKNAFSQSSDKMSISKQMRYFYLADDKVSKAIASYINENNKSSYILEANPGPGLLSKALLETGATHLRVFEANKEYYSSLQNLQSLHSSLDIVTEDLMLLPFMDAKANTEFLEKVFSGISLCSWNDDVPFKVVSVISRKRSIKFLRYLLAALPTTSSVFAYGRCEFYFLLSKTEYMYISAKPKENFSMYRWSTVLYDLFFETKCLMQLPASSFHPLPSTAENKKCKNEDECFYLVKLRPRLDLFDHVDNRAKLSELYFFVRHHLVKRTALVIPTLESWIPLCGPRLIKDGMSAFTKFGDLSPYQILYLFNQFSSWPEYKDSTFQAALQRFYGREIYTQEDEESTTNSQNGSN